MRATPNPPLQRQYPQFAAWLSSLGTTQQAQADAIGVTQRCITHWWQLTRLPTIAALEHRPDGLRAILADIEARQR